jgi:hypothetical protein
MGLLMDYITGDRGRSCGAMLTLKALNLGRVAPPGLVKWHITGIVLTGRSYGADLTLEYLG